MASSKPVNPNPTPPKGRPADFGTGDGRQGASGTVRKGGRGSQIRTGRGR